MSTDLTSDDRLRLFVERIERLEEEKKGISDDVKDVFVELGAVGYDKKATRAVIKLRKQDRQKREEERMILDTYCAALGLE